MFKNNNDEQLQYIQLPSAKERYPEFFKFTEKIIDKLHEWIVLARIPNPQTAIELVRRAFIMRTFNIFKSINLLLANDHWEDAAILTRSLFELLLNVEEVHREEDDRENRARRFLLYNQLQCYIDAKALEEYMINTGRKSRDNSKFDKLDKAAKRVFCIFLEENKKGEKKWAKHWCGKTTWELSKSSDNPNRIHQYKILYSYMSTFAHSAPLSVMSTGDWAPYERDLAQMQRESEEHEKRQVGTILMFSVMFTLEILVRVREVLPGYDHVWYLKILSDFCRLFGWGHMMPSDVREALEISKRKGINNK